MCIFLLNPPAPHCGEWCGNCPCTPKYWLLEIEEYFDLDQGVLVPAFELILERGRGSGSGCTWARQVEDSAYGNFFGRVWRLHYRPFVDVGLGAFEQPGVIGDWVVFLQGRESGGGALDADRDSVYYRKTPLETDHHPGYIHDTNNFHFRCLNANRFYYWDSFNDVASEGPGPLFGWPNELTVTPYYP